MRRHMAKGEKKQRRVLMEDFKVLVVDDEEDFLKTISERLELRDMKPEVAMNGEQALKKVEEEEPTVMILDLRMPGMDGLDVLRQVKKAYPKTQVIILTGRGTKKDEEQARKLGAFAYLQKPVEMDTLVETVRNAHQKFKKIKSEVDAAFMAAAIATTGEVDLAKEVMREEKKNKE
jgi:DNA-binding NtrC family response regulator